ncbi:hypothetical protein [Actinomadura rugatobispora]|uniref:Uncharacterized protein n=1 Tax=Actinomadura rugatobispora TaxID=1994 RepID=A0ABW0ZNB3_9ACTN|nr:hypothetical protein GCM10010200_035920 [Actinomadura rugatobispora]
MTAPQITPEMVQEVAAYRRPVAARIAAYATCRFAGLRVIDACRETGINEATGRNYDKTLPLLRARFDLPEPPKAGTAPSYADPREAGGRGGHQKNHVARGITRPDCPHCQEASP